MRTLLTRQRAATAAVIAASLAVLAACGEKAPSAPAVAPISAGAVLISDGTAVVRIGDRKVTFPTAVTDAVWSPDGSRIAFVDGDGNISTARPDGSSQVVLTQSKDKVARSDPAWFGWRVFFTEKDAQGVSRLMQVTANGHRESWLDQDVTQAYLGEDWPETGTSQASTAVGSDFASELGEVAYERKTAKGAEVWVVDVNQRTPYGVKVAEGTDPALSPDGRQVAFVGKDGQVSVAAVAFPKPGKARQVTSGAASPTHLSWTADGSRIAYSTPSGIESVAAAGGEQKPQSVSASPGVASYLLVARDRVERVTGADPVSTAIAASRHRYPTTRQYMPTEDDRPANGVVLASATQPGYALVAAQLTWMAHGPLLFTSGPSLDPAVKEEMQRILGKVDSAYGGDGPTVYLVGGEDLISAQTQQALAKLGYHTQRITGKDQVGIAAAAAKEVRGTDAALVVSAKDPALAAAAGAGTPAALVLSDGATLPQASKSALAGLYEGVQIYAVGTAAQDAVAGWSGKPIKPAVVPLSTGDGSGTAPLAEALAGSPRWAVVADPASPTEVVIAISLAHAYGGPVLLAGASGVDAGMRDWLVESSGSVDTVLIVGAGVPAEAQVRIGEAIAGPLGYATATNSTMS
jgi:hypothetical protein